VAAKNDVCIWLKDLDEYIEGSHHASLGKKTSENPCVAGLEAKKAKWDADFRGVEAPDKDSNPDASIRMVGKGSR
jgi:hypothetical protein